MTAPVVSLSGVLHAYGPRLALDGVSLDIPAGIMAGLVGPDGVGKSTLLALAAGVRRLQTGDISVLGANLRQAAALDPLRARIAYMPQGLGRNLYPTLSVTENIAYFGRLFGQSAAERRARIAELIGATGLAPFAERQAGQLSGGMKQKLSLCCALMREPDLLILDEPTTGVDPLSRQQFWALIQRLRARSPGMSVLVATAYMEEAESFDWLAAMNAGKVLASGPPASIKGKAASLEDAFIALLPEDSRHGHQPVVVTARPAAAKDAPLAIEAHGLTKRFGDFTAVDHVDLLIPRGEIFGFLGSNGCGKTTTMKMLTGLLAPSEGTARVLGAAASTSGAAKLHVGYMSQSFSLYGELTVRQNLALHAALFQLAATRIDEVMVDFTLEPYADQAPDSLPLGVQQRLQLAAATIHRPALLILDEPTSGVDPVARDMFWHHLLRLSRQDGVTIFISTHFMNEAARCDRISLMHAGRVLAVGTPAEIIASRHAASLEAAFIAYLEAAGGAADTPDTLASQPAAPAAPVRRFDPRRLLACAWRESLELLRDRIRLGFALLGPMVLILAFGFGISFDVEDLPYAALDQDQTPESRELLESFAGSRYFRQQPPLRDLADAEARLQAARIALYIEIPPGFGRDLLRGARPEVSVILDGAMPFRAETMRGYVTGLAQAWLAERGATSPLPATRPLLSIQPRFRYNQAFRSSVAILPGVMMLILIVIPAMMSAIGVVREKETGAIANFRATPVTALEFLVGKQLPYVAVALLNLACLLLTMRFVFAVPVQGSGATLALGGLVYVIAATAFGLLISAFVRTQVAAIFAAAVLSIVPAVNFSGLLVPAASLSGFGRAVGTGFPASWFQQVAIGTIDKGLGLAALWGDILVLCGFAIAFIAAAALALRKQEA